MKHAILLLLAAISFSGCGSGRGDVAAEAPPPAQVEAAPDPSIVQADHPEQFQLTTAIEHAATSKLNVTGVVAPDVSRTVPVISLASGRVVDLRARLGDTVKKGQLLMRVQSADISGAFSDYHKAVADEALARAQFDRAQGLYDHGAISLNDFQIAKDAEDKAKVDLQTTADHLRLLGSNPDHPQGIVDIVAPVSGVITDQQVTNASGVQSLSSTNPFTISDLSNVWIVCDVYENDLPTVRLGDTADVRLNAYPGRVITGRVSNIGAVLDANLRTAKVRLEVHNPGVLRLGLFVTATFHGQKKEAHAAIPASAILHLHDRDWVYVPASGHRFRRTEISAGDMLAGDLQEVVSGLRPGDQVVQNALRLENAVEP